MKNNMIEKGSKVISIPTKIQEYSDEYLKYIHDNMKNCFVNDDFNWDEVDENSGSIAGQIKKEYNKRFKR